MTRVFFVGPVLSLTIACGGAPPAPAETPAPIEAAPAPASVVSTDILAREPVSNRAKAKHILIGWKDKADNYGGGIDPRAAERTREDAEAVVKEILAALAGGADFDTLMRERSEDTGSAQSGRPFEVSPDAGLVIEFRQLGLRLAVDEVGVAESDFGFHIMKRVE
jgi:peptidyl-prolyl cis-trans isomerase D